MKKLATLPGKKYHIPNHEDILGFYTEGIKIFTFQIFYDWVLKFFQSMTIYGCFLIFLLRYQTSQMLVSINYCFPWSVLRFQRFWMSVKIKIFVLYRLQDWNILETIVNNNLQINRSAEFLRLWYLLHFLQPMIYMYNSLSSSDIDSIVQ